MIEGAREMRADWRERKVMTWTEREEEKRYWRSVQEKRRRRRRKKMEVVGRRGCQQAH